MNEKIELRENYTRQGILLIRYVRVILIRAKIFQKQEKKRELDWLVTRLTDYFLRFPRNSTKFIDFL